jgi:hypothetical protein
MATNKKSPKELVENDTCFSFEEFDDVNIKDWLKNNAGSIIILNPYNHVSCFKRSNMKKFTENTTYLFRKCARYEILENAAIKLVVEEKDDRIAMKLATGHLTFYVFVQDVIKQCIKNKRARIFQIIAEDTGMIHWNRTVSEDNYIGAAGVGGWHCQEGTDMDVYTIKPILLENMLDILGEEGKEAVKVLNLAGVRKQSHLLSWDLTNDDRNAPWYTIRKGNAVPELKSTRFLPDERTIIRPRKGLKSCLQSFSVTEEDPLDDALQDHLNDFIFFNSVESAIRFISSRREHFYHATEVVAFVRGDANLLPESALNTPDAYYLCKFQLRDLEAPKLDTFAVINYCTIEDNNNDRFIVRTFAAQFNRHTSIIKEIVKDKHVYVSESLLNLLYLISRMMLYDVSYDAMNRRVFDRSFVLTDRIIMRGAEIPFMIFDADTWIEDGWISDIPTSLPLQALSFSNWLRTPNLFVFFDEKLFPSLEAASVQIREQTNKQYVFVFLSASPVDIIGNIFRNNNSIYLCLCQKEEEEEKDQSVKLIATTAIVVANHPSNGDTFFASQFDRYYFEKHQGVDPAIYASLSLLDIIHFVQLTMYEGNQED